MQERRATDRWLNKISCLKLQHLFLSLFFSFVDLHLFCEEIQRAARLKIAVQTKIEANTFSTILIPCTFFCLFACFVHCRSLFHSHSFPFCIYFWKMYFFCALYVCNHVCIFRPKRRRDRRVSAQRDDMVWRLFFFHFGARSINMRPVKKTRNTYIHTQERAHAH